MIELESVNKLIQETIDSIETARKAPWDIDLLLTRLVIRLELLRDLLDILPNYASDKVIEAFVGTNDAANDTTEDTAEEDKTDAE